MFVQAWIAARASLIRLWPSTAIGVRRKVGLLSDD
jgi:hypothetical protein